MRALFILAALLVATAWLAGPAQATSLVGDETRIELTGSLHGALLTALGPGFLSADGEIVLPVTGGNVNLVTLEGTVEHSGGFSLSNGGGGSVQLGDLLFDLTAGLVLGDLEVQLSGGSLSAFSSLPLFLLRSCFLSRLSEPCLDSQGDLLVDGWGLDWAGSATPFLNDVFSPFPGPILFHEGDAFGVARLDLRLPEPSLPLLLATGLAALALRRRVHAFAGGVK